MALLAEVVLYLRAYWPCIVPILILIQLWRQKYKNGLNDIPGPFIAQFTNIWMFYHVLRGQAVHEVNLQRKYKSNMVRVGPNTVLFSNASAVRKIYGYKPPFEKGVYYEVSTQTDLQGKRYQNLLAARTEEEHGALRRPLSNAYSMSNVVHYEPLINSTTKEFFRVLTERFIKPGRECPLGVWLQFYAFDTIGEMTFSQRLGFLETGKDVGNMIHYTTVMFNYCAVMGHLPGLDKYIRLNNPFVTKFINTPIITFTVNRIREHKKIQHKLAHPDFVTQFTRAAEKYPIMDEARIAENARSTIAAGSDTTGITLRTLVYQLCTKLRIYDKLMAEIKDVLQARPADCNYDEPLKWDEGKNMLYLQACIKEAFRYHPPLAQILPRVVPGGGTTINGRYFPAGVQVGCNSWTVHRDKELYGDNAEEFYPERWIECAPEVRAEMEATSLTFGGGTRVCIGKNIAILEITKFIPEFFRRFELELVDPARFTFTSGLLTTQTGLDVRVIQRDQSFWDPSEKR